MSELTLNDINALKIACVALFCWFYGRGGVTWKFWRRFVGPLIIGVAIWGFGTWTGTFSLLQLLYVPLLCASLHLGYGGTDNVWVKIRKRAIYGLSLGISAFPLAFVSGLWLLFAFHCVVCVSASVAIGVYDIPRSARDNESLIAAFAMLFVLFLI